MLDGSSVEDAKDEGLVSTQFEKIPGGREALSAIETHIRLLHQCVAFEGRKIGQNLKVSVILGIKDDEQSHIQKDGN